MAQEIEEEATLTDGFNLVIDALQLNDINTIYNVPGIPITDLGRYMQGAGMRVLSFRHEQNAGYAAAIAGYLTKKPGVCMTVSAPGFLNGLTALAHATTNCFPMILISGSSEREIVDLQQGDYEEMDQLAIAKPLCKAAYRVLNVEDIGIGIARAIQRPFGANTMLTGLGQLVEVVHTLVPYWPRDHMHSCTTDIAAHPDAGPTHPSWRHDLASNICVKKDSLLMKWDTELVNR